MSLQMHSLHKTIAKPGVNGSLQFFFYLLHFLSGTPAAHGTDYAAPAAADTTSLTATPASTATAAANTNTTRHGWQQHCGGP